jgi:hypothetical protein
MLTPFKLGVGGKMGDGKQWMSWIDVQDMVGAIHHILKSDLLQGPVNMVAPKPVTNAEFTTTLASVLARPAILPVPAFAVKLAFGEMGADIRSTSATCAGRWKIISQAKSISFPPCASLDSVAHGRQGADLSFAEILGFNPESMIETRAVVLPRDPGREFHKFCFGEFLPQARKQRVGDFHGRPGHGVGVFERKPLQPGEIEVGEVAIKISDLLSRNAARSAHGRANIDSKRAADQGCNPKLGESFKPGIDELATGLRLLHLNVSPKDFGMVRRDLDGHDDAAEAAARQKVNHADQHPAEQAALMAGSAKDSRHESLPLN